MNSHLTGLIPSRSATSSPTPSPRPGMYQHMPGRANGHLAMLTLPNQIILLQQLYSGMSAQGRWTLGIQGDEGES